MTLLWIFLFVTSSSWAHQSSLSGSGNEIFWPNPDVPLVINTNTSDLSSFQVRNTIESSMYQWNLSSVAKVSSVGASNNEIKFVSNFPYGNAVIGVTELSYNTKGAIQKASILLNDDYQFRSIPGMYPSMEIYLGDVVTHEIGHMFGLSHSEVLDASMFHSSFSGQSTVSYDDISGIRQKYDGSYGSISGSVRGGNDIGIFGTHVQAISRKTGKVSAVITDQRGDFKLGGLDIGDTYYLYTSPVKHTDSLPGNFSNIQNKFCPASYVGSFFSACGRENDGKPQGVSLSSNRPEADVGIVTINCSLKSDMDYSSEKLSSNFSPVNIFHYDLTRPEKVEQAFVGWFREPSTSSWSEPDIFTIDFSQWEDSNYFLKVSLVSYPLGTQLEYKLNVRSDYQNFINEQRSLVYSPVTETFSTDAEAFIPLSHIGNRNVFELKISSKKLPNAYSAITFPAFTKFSSGEYLPYLVVVSLFKEEDGVKVPVVITEPNLSDNAACLDAPFAFAVSEVQEEKSHSTESQAAPVPASCGTIGPPGNGPGASLPLMTLGFMLALIVSSLGKRRKNFLS